MPLVPTAPLFSDYLALAGIIVPIFGGGLVLYWRVATHAARTAEVAHRVTTLETDFAALKTAIETRATREEVRVEVSRVVDTVNDRFRDLIAMFGPVRPN